MKNSGIHLNSFEFSSEISKSFDFFYEQSTHLNLFERIQILNLIFNFLSSFTNKIMDYYFSWIKEHNSEELHQGISEKDNYDIVLEKIPSNQDEILRNEPTLLSVACFFASLECVKVLLEENASIFAADKLGRQPIHFAAAGGSYDIVQLLFDNGANLFIRDNLSNFLTINILLFIMLHHIIDFHFFNGFG